VNSTFQPRVLVAFIALAVLAGPVTSFVLGPGEIGSDYLGPAGAAVASGAAGATLLGAAALRRERLPRASQWIAMLALLAPQWLEGLLALPGIRGLSALHGTPWGVAFLVALAAPLWLALLSALQAIRDEVPRAVSGASIAGMGAVCLMVPGSAYTVTPKEIPVAVVQVLLGVLTVFSWSYAKPRLAASGTFAVAGCFALLTALGSVAMLPFTPSMPAPLEWREAMLPLLLAALRNAVMWWLWFWLLQRMTLAAFGMRALAAWTAAIAPGFLVFGFLSWRADVAVGISLCALVVALRARAADEQPLALGLESP